MELFKNKKIQIKKEESAFIYKYNFLYSGAKILFFKNYKNEKELKEYFLNYFIFTSDILFKNNKNNPYFFNFKLELRDSLIIYSVFNNIDFKIVNKEEYHLKNSEFLLFLEYCFNDFLLETDRYEQIFYRKIFKNCNNSIINIDIKNKILIRYQYKRKE